MTDDAYKDMTLENNKHIDALTTSVGSIADAISTTNAKIEDLVEVMYAHNVLSEKVDNLDSNVREYSVRMYKEIEDIKSKQQEVGCPQLKIDRESIRAIGRSIDIERHRIDHHEGVINTTVPAATLKWVAAIILTYTISFGVYVESGLNSLRTVAAEKIHMQREINSNVKSALARSEHNMELHVAANLKAYDVTNKELKSLELKVNK